MGLAVSQVRLLALTTRKADIELRMQVNSKRKQMLTRKSTELAQQYYNRLQDSNIQYATSAGYEDVNYDYMMGKTNDAGRYTEDFIRQIMINRADSSIYPTKIENKMILTDQYGQVVCNNQMAEIVKKVDLSYPANVYTTNDKTAFGIVEFIKQNKNNGLSNLYQMISNPDGTINDGQLENLLQIIKLMVQNEGNFVGGTVYSSDLSSGIFYRTLEGMKNQNKDDVVQLQKGYSYTVLGAGNGTDYHSGLSTNNVYVGGVGVGAFLNNDFSEGNLKYLANIVSYFAPILSAAITNGTTAKVVALNPAAGNPLTVTVDPSGGTYTPGQLIIYQDGNEIKGYYKADSAGQAQKIESTRDPVGQHKIDIEYDSSYTTATLCSDGAGGQVLKQCTPPTLTDLIKYLPNLGDWLVWTDAAGTKTYYQTTSINSDGTPYVEKYSGDDSAAKFYEDFIFKTDENAEYYTATNTNELQAGFKSGVYQLCMVDNVAKGIYHKNTTLKYFTHMNYVVDKADSSKREEITAWFNAENAAISEQETYWDTEIQNLSTELTSVTAEIESVKKLKSDSIKNVFNWGGN